MAGLEYDYRRELAYFHLPFYYSISSGNQKLMVKDSQYLVELPPREMLEAKLI
jgi:hypothetical protein